MENTIDYPFQHPAAEEARLLILKLQFKSMAEFRKLPRRDRFRRREVRTVG